MQAEKARRGHNPELAAPLGESSDDLDTLSYSSEEHRDSQQETLSPVDEVIAHDRDNPDREQR